METKGVIKSLDFITSATILPVEHFYVYKMLFIVEGTIRISFYNRSYIVKPNSLVFFSNFEEHSLTVLEKPYQRYFLTMIPTEVDRLVKYPELLTVFKNPITFNNIFDVSPTASVINDFFTEMTNEFKHYDEYSEQLIQGLLYKLLVRLYRDNIEIFPKVNLNSKINMYEIQLYIDQHFNKKILVSDIADRFFISTSYLTHSFKNYTGYTPMQYLKLNRLSYARNLLISTELSIAEVAYRSGFGDINNFIKAFKEQYKTTPKQIRITHKQNLLNQKSQSTTKMLC